jgi:hypothetical protein
MLHEALILVGVTAEQSWLDYISRIGVVAILVISHYGFHKRWWVWGYDYEDLVKRHEMMRERLSKTEDQVQAWKEQALTGGRIAAGATTIAAAAITRGEQLRQER